MNKIRCLIKVVITVSLSFLLFACGSTPQPTITLDSNILAQPDTRIGVVYISPNDKPTTHIFGASCLLCYGVASSLTGKLDTHLESSISEEELLSLRQLVMSEYSQKAANISFIDLVVPFKELKKFKGDLGYAQKDFRPLKDWMNIDVLVVLHVARHGAYRSFSSYIPNSDPQGHVFGWLYTVDLETNAYMQYLEISENVQPEGEWDEPNNFPSVTTAYYQAIENAKQKIKNSI